MYDKLILHIVLVSTVLFMAFATFLAYFIVRYKNREQEHRLEKQRLMLELAKKELGMGFKERELVLEEVSEDIHDNVTQVILLIKTNLYKVEQLCTDPEQMELIRYVTYLVQHIIDDTKFFSHSLNSDFIKTEGLCHMLEHEVELINSTKKINASITVTGNDKMLSPEAQLLVYRIAQEAIRNTLRHASADKLDILLSYKKDSFRMKISDDGTGFGEQGLKGETTQGIANMYKRAKVLDGKLQFITVPGKGTHVILYCPGNANTIGTYH